MKNRLIVLMILLITLNSHAAEVDTVSIYSTAMQKAYKCVVIKPAVGQEENKLVPALYLLHGHGGWYANWLLQVPELKDYADRYRLLIVCPDGGYNSWYLDSPVDSTVRFETYISEVVPDYIDNHYPTIPNRQARAITGLSMGGHGGLFLGFRHADKFGACGSMSGGVDLQPFTRNWQLIDKLGDTVNHRSNWKNYSVINLVETKPANSLAIIIDCGTEDFFYTVNHTLHEKMVALKIPHDYIERPGKHDWAYWRNAIQYQLLFFSNYFKK
ncbi:MAG: alpha/beta hydrolase family protein [Bacteroidota bacterium]|nr:alpha/beta hydrolase family protein [Bacteroidota bacterium]